MEIMKGLLTLFLHANFVVRHHHFRLIRSLIIGSLLWASAVRLKFMCGKIGYSNHCSRVRKRKKKLSKKPSKIFKHQTQIMLSLSSSVSVQNNLFSFKSNHSADTLHVWPQSKIKQSSPLSQVSFQKFQRVFATVSDGISATEEREVSGRAGVSAELPEGLQKDLMPRHVAVIMDGNARWARQKGLPASAGHEAGVRSLRKLVEICGRWGISVLTVFAFSYDNWIRPKVEVDFLMSLFERGIKSELDNFLKEGIRISVIGDSSKLPASLQKLITDAEESTKDNSLLQLIVAVSYSGQYDIVQACKSIAQKVKDGLIDPEDINVPLVEQELETNCTEYPYPDLLIRTSGELRVSNFLLWQLAYSELFFVGALWPDFGEEEFVDALRSYQQRQRRYGGR